MLKLEELQPNSAVRGIIPDALATVVSVQWFGSEALELTYKNPAGKVANELLCRHDEQRLDLVEQGRPWSFDGDGALFRLCLRRNAQVRLHSRPGGIPEDSSHNVRYLRRPFQKEPDFGVTSVNYHFAELLERAEAPR